ncbi:MAG: hypothetical protein K8S99_12175 [Planctomycetes bacterium]|nr:hypothetical protein [Planctomycetota bacterium]
MTPHQPSATPNPADTPRDATQRALVVMIGGILAALVSIVVLLALLLNRPAATLVVQPNAAATATGPATAIAPANGAAGRSPLPQPGETIAQPFPANRLDGQSADPTSPLPTTTIRPPPVVPWTLAAQHVDETVTVEGEVVDTYNTGTVCFLNFTRDKKGDFYIIIFQEALKGWPGPPQDYFLNKTIRVTGQVMPHNARTQIRVRNPSQIKLVEEP